MGIIGKMVDMDDSRAFREALSDFATGVAIITAHDSADNSDDRRAAVLGLTVNSFSSVSLVPPLVLWCLGRSAAAFDLFSKARRFGISILNETQRDLSIACARHAKHELLPHQIEITPSGAAFIKGAVVCFDCAVHDQIEAGDHLIIIGKVASIKRQSGRPLIYHHSAYGHLK